MTLRQKLLKLEPEQARDAIYEIDPEICPLSYVRELLSIQKHRPQDPLGYLGLEAATFLQANKIMLLDRIAKELDFTSD